MSSIKNPVIEEIHRELDALIEVIKAFEQQDGRSDKHQVNGTWSEVTSQTGGTTGRADGVSSSKATALNEALNQELVTMFSAAAIAPATGRLRLPTTTRGKSPLGNQVRYVKVHLIASYARQEDVFRGKVTFTTYTIDNRERSEDRAADHQRSQENVNSSDDEGRDMKPKVTHTKGKVHVLRDDLQSKKLALVKESLADYALRIKCRLEQRFNFNLYDWRSDTHSLEESQEPEALAYEKILMYKKTLDPRSDETASWESDTQFLSELIN